MNTNQAQRQSAASSNQAARQQTSSSNQAARQSSAQNYNSYHGGSYQQNNYYGGGYGCCSSSGGAGWAAAGGLAVGMVLGAAVASAPKSSTTVSSRARPISTRTGLHTPAPSGSGYVVVQAPPGAAVSTLPPAAITVQANGQSYEYLSGVFYQAGYGPNGQLTYQVVQAPLGATVYSLPQGVKPNNVGGAAYYNYGSTWFRLLAGTRPSLVVPTAGSEELAWRPRMDQGADNQPSPTRAPRLPGPDLAQRLPTSAGAPRAAPNATGAAGAVTTPATGRLARSPPSPSSRYAVAHRVCWPLRRRTGRRDRAGGAQQLCTTSGGRGGLVLHRGNRARPPDRLHAGDPARGSAAPPWGRSSATRPRGPGA
jgi:hypothetical protein